MDQLHNIQFLCGYKTQFREYFLPYETQIRQCRQLSLRHFNYTVHFVFIHRQMKDIRNMGFTELHF